MDKGFVSASAGILALVFSIPLAAMTLEELVEKHGKKNVALYIREHGDGQLFISRIGSSPKLFVRPNVDHVNLKTLQKDMDRLKFNADYIDEHIEIEARKKEKREKELQTKEVARQKRMLEAQRLGRLHTQTRTITQREYQAQASPPTSNNPVCAIPFDQVRRDSLKHFGSRYPDSFSTQKLLHKSNLSAYQALCNQQVNDAGVRVLKKLIGRYYPSFSTIKTLYQSNMKAYQELYR